MTTNPTLANNPLIYAASDFGSIGVYHVLSDNGRDINTHLKFGGSPLVSACEVGDVGFLLDQGADPNIGYASGDYEALLWATVGTHPSLDIVELLLAWGTAVKGRGA